MTRRLAGALLSILLATVAIAGCDPSNSREPEVRAAIRDALASLASGDAADFCPRLSEDADAVGRFAEEFGGPCDQERVDQILADHTPEQREALLDPQIAVIKINTDTAGATVNSEYLQMRDIGGGDWKLSSYEIPPTRESIRENAGLEP